MAVGINGSRAVLDFGPGAKECQVPGGRGGVVRQVNQLPGRRRTSGTEAAWPLRFILM